MDVKIDGERHSFDLKEQTTAWLLDTNRELQAAAQARGLDLPAGATAIEGAQDTAETEPTSVKKEILDQIPSAHQVFNEVVGILNQDTDENNRIPDIDEEALGTELNTWLTEERLALIEAIRTRSPDSVITLVAAPNIGVSGDDLIRMHTQFGEVIGHKTLFWKHIRTLYGKYSGGRELTSSRGYGPVNFSIDIFSDRLNHADNRIILQDVLQETAASEGSDVELRVPSPLDAEVYRRTLVALEGNLGNKAFIPHYNLPPQLLPVTWAQKAKLVPLSLIDRSGALSVGWSPIGYPDDDARYFLR